MENSTQFVLTVAYLNMLWNVGEFLAFHLHCIRVLNIVSKGRFFLYLNIRGLRKGPGNFFIGVLESPGFFC